MNDPIQKPWGPNIIGCILLDRSVNLAFFSLLDNLQHIITQKNQYLRL